jgi:L-fuculose-phosphate aldolase
MDRDEAKRKLIDAGLVIGNEGMDDFTRGHISVRDPGDPDLFFMKPHSFGLDEITMENIVTCNLAGEKVAGSARRHSEVFIHSEIFRARPDINAVLHAHPKHAIALSIAGWPLHFWSLPSTEFADGVGMFEETRDLIRTPEQGASVAAALGSRRAVLLRNHGIVIAGRTMEECIVLAITFENACELQLMVHNAGAADAPEIPADQVESLHGKLKMPEQYEINFDYLVRRARRAKGAA